MARTFTCNSALRYDEALELVKKLKAAGLQASIISGGIWASAEDDAQMAKLYEISKPYGVLFRDGFSGTTQNSFKPPADN